MPADWKDSDLTSASFKQTHLYQNQAELEKEQALHKLVLIACLRYLLRQQHLAQTIGHIQFNSICDWWSLPCPEA